MTEIACQTYSLRSRQGADVFTSVRKAGFRAVELWVGHADYRAAGSARAVRRTADEIGIAIRAYSVGGLLGVSPSTVASRLAGAFDYAGALGAEVVTGVIERRALGVVDALCQRTGMRFAIENHWYADFARSGDYLPILQNGTSPLIGVTLDTGHLAAAGEDPVAAFAVLGERVLAVHLKDVRLTSRLGRWVWRRPRMEGCTLGAGEARVAALLGALARAGWSGSLAIEDERPELPLAELHAALRTCTRLMRAGAPSAQRA